MQTDTVTLTLVAADGSTAQLVVSVPLLGPRQPVTFADFTQAGGVAGMLLPAAGYAGGGSGVTVLEMAAGTSTKAGVVPAQGTGKTNPLYLLATPSGGSAKLSGFTLQATDQGHLYGGIKLDHQTGHVVSDVQVLGVPGAANLPPGETFGVNDWGGTDGLITGVLVDGLGVGAAGIGTNSSTNITIADSTVQNCPYSSPTHWQTVGITVTNFASLGNNIGYNHERASGKIRYSGLRLELNPKLTAGMHLTFDNDQADAPDIVLEGVSWTAAGSPSSVTGGALAVMIADGYRKVTNADGSITYMQKQKTLPTITNAAGRTLQWADAGTKGDPANGLPAVPSSNMSAARADPGNWAVRFH